VKNRVWKIVTLGFIVVAINTPLITYASASTVGQAPVDATVISSGSSTSTGIFVRTVGSGQSTLLAPSPLVSGYCELIAEYVHLSTSTVNNLAGNAVVKCHGTSIRITSIHVTLYKAGLIDHFLTGPYSAGYADSASPYYYSIFKTPCNSSTLSTYWSTAYGTGTYPDGSPTQATVTSPKFPLTCGTSW